MAHYFRVPEPSEFAAPETCANGVEADQAKLDRMKQHLDAIFQKRTMASYCLQSFTRISGMTVPDGQIPKDGATLCAMLMRGGLTQTRS